MLNNMLESLRSIVQEVNAADDLQSMLNVTVERVHATMGTEVCSVYLREPTHNRYVFSATEGLNKGFVNKISMAADEGLVGQVAQREEPINLEDAESHPKFLFMPGIGEERFSSFLGVPIIHQRQVLGVLIVQQQERRRFDEAEEAFLVTVSAQLAAVIAHAQVTGAVVALEPGQRSAASAQFKGRGGSVGIAIGEAVVVSPPAELQAVPSRPCADVEGELTFFHECLEAVRQEMKELAAQLSSRLAPEEQALFDVYLRMLDDSALASEVDETIRQGEWAQGAWSRVILKHVRTFSTMSDTYLKERASDVKDLGRRVLAHLQAAHQDVVEYPERTILVGEELTASMLGEVPPEKLAGLVSVRGSASSHVAILARSMGVPTVMGVMDLPYTRLEGSRIIVDGYNSHIYFNPSEELHGHFHAIWEEEKQLAQGLEQLRDLPTITTDNHRLSLLVNTGLHTDIARSLGGGAEGVGLYRTEVPFLLSERFPSEEEQRKIYREQLEAFAPMKVTMRTLDVGGDKALPYFPIEEENPFLGWRGIRVTLDHPEIFLVQVRAMMKANAGLNNLRIMLPMISSVPELEESLELIYRAHEELIDELGEELVLPEIGVMVEVPSAVYQTRAFARRVDFISVGSNDLTQYLLAVDRNNARVANVFQMYHPAVWHALRAVADASLEENKPVSVCGELAGDPMAAVLLMALGFDSLSMSPTNLPKVKSVIRQVSLDQAKQWLAHIRCLENATEIREYLEQELAKVGTSRLLRPAISGGVH